MSQLYQDKIERIPVRSTEAAARKFTRLLTSSFTVENFVEIPMMPQRSDEATRNSGVRLPNRGRKGSLYISPAINVLIPNAIASKTSCFFLKTRRRFLPFLIFKVSRTILKAIMKHKTRTIIFEIFSKRCIKVFPRRCPRIYIMPWPRDRDITRKKFLPHDASGSALKAVDATSMQKVSERIKRILIIISEKSKERRNTLLFTKIKLKLFYWFELNCEVAHNRCFPNYFHTVFDAVSSIINVFQSGGDDVHVVIGIDAAWHAEADEVVTTEAVLTCLRVTVSEEVANLATTDTGFKIKFHCKGLSWELFFRDVCQDLVSINEDGVATDRALVRDAVLIEF